MWHLSCLNATTLMQMDKDHPRSPKVKSFLPFQLYAECNFVKNKAAPKKTTTTTHAFYFKDAGKNEATLLSDCFKETPQEAWEQSTKRVGP